MGFHYEGIGSGVMRRNGNGSHLNGKGAHATEAADLPQTPTR
jgi:hypothetical protein